MLKVGDIAPDFELKDQSGSSVSLDHHLSMGDLVLYFYPADFTRVCTAEACAFRDVYDDLSEVKVQIIGISPQGADSHNRFAGQYNLPFPLLCDERKEVIRAYGVDGPLGYGVRRVTFLINGTKHIKNRVVADLFVRRHIELIKAVIKEFKRS
jgi:peroxiredoxin Q/BCP